MQVLILDEFRQRGSQIAEAIGSSSGNVVNCQLSNEFMTVLAEKVPGKILVDLPTWNSGRSIYNYFKVSRKLENIPIIFYNTPDDFDMLQGRPRHNRDKILPKPTTVESVAEATLNQE